MSHQQQYRLDALYFRRVGKLLRPYWTSRASLRGWLALGALIATAPLVSWSGLRISELSGSQTNALLGRHTGLFIHLLTLTVVFSLGRAGLQSLQQLVDGWLTTDWRRHLTTHLTDQYLARRTYYEILTTESVDNPDQRIQMEVAPFCQIFTYLPRMALSSMLDVTLQAGLLYYTSQWLFFAAVLFLTIRFTATLFVYRPTIRLNYDLTVREADLRYGLLQVREHGESVAFYRGEAAERRQVLARLQRTLGAQWHQLRYLALVTAVMGLLGVVWNVLPLAIMGPLYLAHRLDYGSIAKATQAALTLLNAVGVIEQFIPIMSLAAPSVVRLGEVSEAYEGRQFGPASSEAVPRITLSSGTCIQVEALTLYTPGGERALVRDLSLRVGERHSLAIAGITGVGKSSLLRAMAGLWTRGQGRIVLPPPDELFFLPQKPYLVLGSLRDQLTYPWRGAERHDDEALQNCLDRVHLGNLTERFGGLDAVQNWGLTLSLGEQQRLGFCRVLLNPTPFVLLDEATSAIDAVTEEHLYDMLRRQGCAFLSVCHRPSAMAFHQRVLRLLDGGAWEFCEGGRGLSAAVASLARANLERPEQ